MHDPPGPDEPRTLGPARIVCRRVWKVYGDPAGDSLSSLIAGDADPPAVIDRLRAEGLIPAVCNVSFEVFQGEIFVIMGLSGSGKSTIVRCLSRLIEPTAGEVLIDDQDIVHLTPRQLIEVRRHKMGMVFQNFGLLPHLNVLDNVAYPLRVQGIPRQEREKRALEMIELVGLDGRETSFPRELSGGMQQRVGIARSLAVKPDIWLLDEPFSALDPLIRRQMQDEFLRLQGVLKKTIVFITHDFLEALRLADRIAIMREGQIVQTGSPADLVLNPAGDYVAEFTRDVPRAKVVTAESIAEAPANGLDVSRSVSGRTTIEKLLRDLARHPGPLAVRGDDGEIVGQITGDLVLQALAQSTGEDE
ncbi:MAG TPA: betaine/proline/choline family ABC transporter ATP-binding protein [Kiloniellales bacterium]